MTNFFIIHGVEGYPEENWFPWLLVGAWVVPCSNVFID